jgi:hypothetical protein
VRRDFDFLREWKLKATKGRDPTCRSDATLSSVLAAVQVKKWRTARTLDLMREWKLKATKGWDTTCRSAATLSSVLAAVQVKNKMEDRAHT